MLKYPLLYPCVAGAAQDDAGVGGLAGGVIASVFPLTTKRRYGVIFIKNLQRTFKEITGKFEALS